MVELIFDEPTTKHSRQHYAYDHGGLLLVINFECECHLLQICELAILQLKQLIKITTIDTQYVGINLQA